MAMSLKRSLCLARNFPVLKNTPITSVRNISLVKYPLYQEAKIFQDQSLVEDHTKIESEMSQNVFDKVNEQISNKSHGRLFAVVQIYEMQYKITVEDIIVVKKNWAPTIGDKIRLEKVLLVGSSDFTLFGRPLLPSDQVAVYATVIEKTFSHTIPVLTYTARRNNTRCNFLKHELTYLRINAINLTGKVNQLGDTDGLSGRIFQS